MTEVVENEIKLPWHHYLWEWADARVKSKTLPHALLLKGQAGMGKATFAKQLAHWILCERYGHSNAPCGRCQHCVWYRSGSHPDFHTITPEETGRIRIETIRSLIDTLSRTGYASCRKVVTIYAPECMQASAANALLKTLEEPPGRFVLFILVSEQSFLLPATLRSRCQQLHFKPAFDRATQAWLAKKINLSMEPMTCLQLAEGAPLTAIAQQSQHLEKETLWQEQLQQLLDKTQKPLDIARAWSEENLLALLQFLQRQYSQKVIANFKSRSVNHEFKLLDAFQLAKQKVLQQANLNAQLMMESLVIEIGQLAKGN